MIRVLVFILCCFFVGDRHAFATGIKDTTITPEQEQAVRDLQRSSPFNMRLHNPQNPPEMEWAISRSSAQHYFKGRDAVIEFVEGVLPTLYRAIRQEDVFEANIASRLIRDAKAFKKLSTYSKGQRQYAVVEHVYDMRSDGFGKIYAQAYGYQVTSFSPAGSSHSAVTWEVLISEAGQGDYTLEEMQLRSVPKRLLNAYSKERIRWEFSPDLDKEPRKIPINLSVQQAKADRSIARINSLKHYKRKPFSILNPKIKPLPWGEWPQRNVQGQSIDNVESFLLKVFPEFYHQISIGYDRGAFDDFTPDLVREGQKHVREEALANDNRFEVEALQIDTLKAVQSPEHDEVFFAYLTGILGTYKGGSSLKSALAWEILVKEERAGFYKILDLQTRQPDLVQVDRIMRRQSPAEQ